jgi:hypothetical protein
MGRVTARAPRVRVNTEVGKEAAGHQGDCVEVGPSRRFWGGWVIREIVGRLGHQGDCGEVGSSGRRSGQSSSRGVQITQTTCGPISYLPTIS